MVGCVESATVTVPTQVELLLLASETVSVTAFGPKLAQVIEVLLKLRVVIPQLSVLLLSSMAGTRLAVPPLLR